MRRLNAKLRYLTTAGCFFLSLAAIPVYGSDEKAVPKTVAEGMKVPPFTLDAPISEKDRKYLVLKEGATFNLSQIPAKLLVLEIFSLYCPHCRKQVPKLNEIYRRIQQDHETMRDIKIIGIAAGGSQDKTDKWKTVLHVPFPLFADLETVIWTKFGKPGVPYTLLVQVSRYAAENPLNCHLFG